MLGREWGVPSRKGGLGELKLGLLWRGLDGEPLG